MPYGPAEIDRIGVIGDLRAVDLDTTKSLSKGMYNSVSSALIEASQIGVEFEGKTVYLKPAQYQALVWIVIRGASK